MHSKSYVRTPSMTFFEAVGKCYRKYFTFKGRASKREYWWFALLGFLFAWPLALTEVDIGFWYLSFGSNPSILNFIYFMLTISVLFPGAAVWTRRMHDVGRSGWTWTLLLVPVVGFIMVMRWLLKEGDPEENRYGFPDNLPAQGQKQESIKAGQ